MVLMFSDWAMLLAHVHRRDSILLPETREIV